MKQIHRHGEQTCGYQGKSRVWGKGLEIWDKQMQTILQKIYKQQGSTMQYMELNSISSDKP